MLHQRYMTTLCNVKDKNPGMREIYTFTWYTFILRCYVQYVLLLKIRSLRHSMKSLSFSYINGPLESTWIFTPLVNCERSWWHLMFPKLWNLSTCSLPHCSPLLENIHNFWRFSWNSLLWNEFTSFSLCQSYLQVEYNLFLNQSIQLTYSLF